MECRIGQKLYISLYINIFISNKYIRKYISSAVFKKEDDNQYNNIPSSDTPVSRWEDLPSHTNLCHSSALLIVDYIILPCIKSLSLCP